MKWIKIDNHRIRTDDIVGYNPASGTIKLKDNRQSDYHTLYVSYFNGNAMLLISSEFQTKTELEKAVERLDMIFSPETL